jgi:hypothetical protein
MLGVEANTKIAAALPPVAKQKFLILLKNNGDSAFHLRMNSCNI